MNRNDLPAPNAICEVCGREYRRCKKCIEMKSRGIEAWREHCDSMECYQTLILTQMDPSVVTKEQYDRIMSFEYPEGRKPVADIKKKLKTIKENLDTRKVEKTEAIKDVKTYTSKYNTEIKKDKEKMNVK